VLGREKWSHDCTDGYNANEMAKAENRSARKGEKRNEKEGAGLHVD
jgi:hypothetical protein